MVSIVCSEDKKAIFEGIRKNAGLLFSMSVSFRNRVPMGFFFLVCMASYFFMPGSVFAQMNGNDSSIYRGAISTATNLYQQSAGDQSGLYNGALYPGYPYPFKKGIPFFISDQMDSGWVLYDNILYKGLRVQYDNLSEMVIVEDNGFPIVLNNKRLKAFKMGTRSFISEGKRETTIDGIDHWFYEVLQEGSCTVLKRILKTVTEDLSNNQTIDRLINPLDYYFFKIGAVIYPISAKKDLLAIFPAEKKEIKQFIKQNKLNFRRNKGDAFLRVAAYYEQIRK
jgi:hypothetical protein